MKIDGDIFGIQSGATDRSERASDSPQAGKPVTSSPGRGDQLQLSADVQLARAAVEAAQGLPAARPELVERMRALVAQRQVGADALRLADAIIDRWLTLPVA